jgi:hypothetical protein
VGVKTINEHSKKGETMRDHITKRGKGSFSIVLDLGRDPSSGKRRQH